MLTSCNTGGLDGRGLLSVLKYFLETLKTSLSQPIIVRERIFKTQNLRFAYVEV